MALASHSNSPNINIDYDVNVHSNSRAVLQIAKDDITPRFKAIKNVDTEEGSYDIATAGEPSTVGGNGHIQSFPRLEDRGIKIPKVVQKGTGLRIEESPTIEQQSDHLESSP